MKMRVIIDTNKLIASMLKDNRVRKLFFNPRLEFYAPSLLLEEIEKYKDMIIGKVSEELFRYIMDQARDRIVLLDAKEYMKEAELIASFDIYDSPFIALALKLNIPIWSNDKQLIKYSFNSRYTAIDTIALESILKGLKIEDVLRDLRTRYYIM
ncbi:MAG: nucleotide-binding protein [Candidatus Nitrosocaldaceae archaeon]|nr:MAG: nucleotide-binding protein [Candidatus Nitrosocaldaceae archaeon]